MCCDFFFFFLGFGLLEREPPRLVAGWTFGGNEGPGVALRNAALTVGLQPIQLITNYNRFNHITAYNYITGWCNHPVIDYNQL